MKTVNEFLTECVEEAINQGFTFQVVRECVSIGDVEQVHSFDAWIAILGEDTSEMIADEQGWMDWMAKEFDEAWGRLMDKAWRSGTDTELLSDLKSEENTHKLHPYQERIKSEVKEMFDNAQPKLPPPTGCGKVADWIARGEE